MKNLKICTGCKKNRKLTSFWTKNGRPQAQCKDCQTKYHKKHYLENKDRYLERALNRNKTQANRIQSIINSMKESPCMDCGEIFPYYVMDFDHRPNEEKLTNISRMRRRYGTPEQEILEEIAKCDLVCANCHRKRTHRRINDLGLIRDGHGLQNRG